MDGTIYFDLARVTTADVVAATARLPTVDGKVELIRRSDADWVADGGADGVISGPRADSFRVRLNDAMLATAGTLRSDASISPRIRVGGVDVIEVGWYDWLFSMATAAYRAWALEELIARAPSGPIAVVTTEPAAWSGLAELATARGAQLTLAGVGTESAPRVSAVRRLVRQTRARVGPLLPIHRRPDSTDHPLVLFAEDFPHLATALLGPAQGLRDGNTVTVRFAGTHSDVLEVAAAAGLETIDVGTATSRAARIKALWAGSAAAAIAPRAVAAAIEAGVAPGGSFAAGIEHELVTAAESAWRRAAAAAVLWGELHDQISPAVVVTGTYTGNSTERAAVLTAARRNIPTAFVQHGMVSDEAWKSRLVHDHYLVWGEQARRLLIDAGAPSEQVIATGSTKLPTPSPSATTPTARADLRVLYLPSRTDGRFVSRPQAEAMFTLVRRAIAAVDGAHLTVKVHPDDRTDLFDPVRLDGAIDVVHRGDTPGLITAADVVVVATSTAGYEACALDRPVVVLALDGIDTPLEYRRYGAALEATTAEELATSLRQIADDDDLARRLRQGRRRLVDHVFGPPGDASAKIGVALMEIARAPSTTCVYYDFEVVASAQLVSEPADAIHLVDDDVTWDHGPVERVTSRRSPAARRELMGVVDDLFAALRAEAGLARRLSVAGVDVLDVARYDWYSRLADPVHRARVASYVVDRWAPARLVWVCGEESAFDPGSLAAWLAERGVFLTVRPQDRQPRAARPKALSGRAIVRALRPRGSTAATERGVDPVVAFAEHFERGSRVAARIVSAAPPGSDFRLLAATNTAAVPELGSRSHVIADLLTRRTRLRALMVAARIGRRARSLDTAGLAQRTSGLASVTVRTDTHFREAAADAWLGAAAAIPAWQELLARLQPAVVASTTNAPSTVRAAMAVARGRGSARTCLVQHGALTTMYPGYFDHDRHLVWGERDREHLVGLGVPAELIDVTGPPTLDGIAARRDEIRRDRMERIPGGDRATRVLYLPSRSGGRFVSTAVARRLLDTVVAATAQLERASLTVKVHPSDTSDVFNALPPGVMLLRDADTLAEIGAADVVVVSTSTAGFEACAVDVPTVVLVDRGVDEPAEYRTYGAALVASGEEELSTAMRRSLEGENGALAAGRRRLVDALFGGLRPGAAARAAAALAAMCHPPR